MADKQIIAASLSVETGNSNTNIKEVNKNANELRGTLAATGKEAKKTSGAIEESGGSFGKLKEQISKVPGPLGEAGEGVGKLSAAFKALLANPVVLILAAIVATLALLYKAFTNTFEGGEKVEQIFAGIKAAGQALIDNLTKIGGAIVKAFKFDFSGAIDDIKGVAKAAGDAFDTMGKLTKRAQELSREQATNDLDQAKRAARLAQLREQQAESTDPKARKAAALELQQAAKEDAINDLKLAKDKAENAIAMLTLEKDGERKNFIEIEKIKTDQVRGQTESANELRRIAKSVTATERQEVAEQKAIQKEKEAAGKEFAAKAKANAEELKKLQDEIYKQSLGKQDQEILAIENKYAKELALLKKNHADSLLLEQNFRNSLNKIIAGGLQVEVVTVKKAAGEKITVNDMLRDRFIKSGWEVNAAHQIAASIDQHIGELESENRLKVANGYAVAADMIADVLGRSTAVGKGLAVAASLINTYSAIVGQLKAFSTYGVPGYAIAQAIATGLVGLATVKKIISVQVPGGRGGGSVPSGSISLPSSPIAPQAQTTTLNQASINGIGNAAAPVRAYVVDVDSTTHRERNERLNRAARLGG